MHFKYIWPVFLPSVDNKLIMLSFLPVFALQQQTFLSEVNNKGTIGTIKMNNDTYCLGTNNKMFLCVVVCCRFSLYYLCWSGTSVDGECTKLGVYIG